MDSEETIVDTSTIRLRGIAVYSTRLRGLLLGAIVFPLFLAMSSLAFRLGAAPWLLLVVLPSAAFVAGRQRLTLRADALLIEGWLARLELPWLEIENVEAMPGTANLRLILKTRRRVRLPFSWLQGYAARFAFAGERQQRDHALGEIAARLRRAQKRARLSRGT